MTDNRSFARMPMEPRSVLYDQNGRIAPNVDLSSSSTPVELHGLYCKKFRLIEKLENLRKGYILPKGVPAVNVHKVRMERKFTPWDYVLEEVKWTAIDMIEERKAKLTVCSFLSKKLKKDVKQRQTHHQEKTIYHRLVSSEMASMVTTVFSHFRSKRQSVDVKREDEVAEIKEEEDRNGETYFGDIRDEDILNYDEMKMKVEEPSQKNGEGAREKGVELPVDAVISDAFKPKKLKDSGALLRKYIDSFIAYEERAKAKEIVIEDDENFPTPAAFLAKKIDKVFYFKELQRCMNKWGKNKSSTELNDVFSKLIKDVSESESMLKLQKDNISTYSAPSVKEADNKKRKKGSNQHLTAPTLNVKDIKDPPVLRKMTDSNIEQANQPSTKEHKKNKDKENTDEMLIMYYEQPLKDAEFEVMFKNSIANNKSFPKRVDELQTVGFVKAIEKDRIYREFTFDPDYDDFVSDNCLELEAYVSQIDRKYSSDPKRMTDEIIRQKVRSLPIECSVQIQDVFNFLPHIEEKPFFIYMDKVIKFIRASEDSPEFKKQLDNITWPLHADYFYERLHETHGNRYAIITDALNSNILTKGNHKYQEKISEFKWLFMHSNKNRKFFNCAKKRLPSYSTVTKEIAYSDAQEEKKQSLPQGSSHQRFNLRFHVDKFKDYHKEKEDKKTKESYESSFLLFQNIKTHLRQDTSRGLYGGEGPQPTRMPEAIEHVALNRMIWPEAMNQNLISKIQSGQPLTGRPIDKEKTPYPHLDKIIDEIIGATYVQPDRGRPIQPSPQPMPQNMNPINMPMPQPHPVPVQGGHPVPSPSMNPQNPMQHVGMQPSPSQPSNQPLPQLPTVNSPHLPHNQMAPNTYGHNMKYPPNINPQHNPQMVYPNQMRGPGNMVPDPMRQQQPAMIPTQHTPEMYDQNNQPMSRPPTGGMPRGMPQNMPPNMQPNMQPTMQPNMQPNMGPNMPQNMPPNMVQGMQSNMPQSMPQNMPPQGYSGQMAPNNPKMMMGGPSGGPPNDGRSYPPHNQQYYNNMPNNIQMQQMMKNRPQQYQMQGINNMNKIGPNPVNPMMGGGDRNVNNMSSGSNMMNMSNMPNMPNGGGNMGHGNMPMNPSMGNPSMGNPSMGNPGMGNPSMGNPAMGGPHMGQNMPPNMNQNMPQNMPPQGYSGQMAPSNPNMPMGGMPMGGSQPNMGPMAPMNQNPTPDTTKTRNTKKK